MRGRGGQVVNNPPWGMKVRIRQETGLKILIWLPAPIRCAAFAVLILVSTVIACETTAHPLLPIEINWEARAVSSFLILLTAVCVTAALSGSTRISLTANHLIVRYPLWSLKRRAALSTESLVGFKNERHEKVVSDGENRRTRVDMDLVVVQNGSPRERCLLSVRRWAIAAYARETLQRYLKMLRSRA